MDEKLYGRMDWSGIEEIVYSEAAGPHDILGPHRTEDGLLIQAFIPTAVSVKVRIASSGKEFPMELVDETGFFAVLIPRRSIPEYTLLVVYDNGLSEELTDPYLFPPLYTESDLKKFEAGSHYSVYEKMGAHPMMRAGVNGVYFSVWAPCAMRVSVVGDFNLWDGRRHQMRRLGDSGIFELFIPGLSAGIIYKYEIKSRSGDIRLKSDPYGSFCELHPGTASVVWDMNQYDWKDGQWMEERARTDWKERPMSIYEVHPGSFMRKETESEEEGACQAGHGSANYRELAEKLAYYVKQMGFTHVELMPVMEHSHGDSWGYQVTGYYAPSGSLGTPDDFMYFMDYMHAQGIGVILDWVPAYFPKDDFGLSCFDGTCVYEHLDPRQGTHPRLGMLIYNYGRPQVANFLIANALYWADRYHADGIRMASVSCMLYLDYEKNPGEWIPNIYGGNENLEAVDFLKHLNSVFKSRTAGAVLIAEELSPWPRVTGNVRDGALGFDFKWNTGWKKDFTGYLQFDPFFRKHHYGKLTFSLEYAYSEAFILAFSHEEEVHDRKTLMSKMPGKTLEEKAANLRTAYGFMAGHPGKKLLFMGQEFGQLKEWDETAGPDWDLLQVPIHRQMQDYVKALNRITVNYPALYEMDYKPEGFEWLNASKPEESIVVFLRKTGKKAKTLLFVCNFDSVYHKKFRIGVPFDGMFKEIINSDAAEFGGEGRINIRARNSRQREANGRPDSIEIAVAPLSFLAFTCIPSDGRGKRKRPDPQTQQKPENEKNVRHIEKQKGAEKV